jgi:hypothetical protein
MQSTVIHERTDGLNVAILINLPNTDFTAMIAVKMAFCKSGNLPTFDFTAMIAVNLTHGKFMPLNSERRKLLASLVPDQVIVSKKWLMQHRLGVHAIDNLVKARQLQAVTNGVYTNGNPPTSWEAIVYSLQYIFDLKCVVGGLTALDLQGFSHYLRLGKKSVVNLYVAEPLPKWIDTLSDDISFRSQSSRPIVGNRTMAFTRKIEWRQGLPGIFVSTPERAILEVLLDLPEKITFEHADELMQGLTTLSPDKLQHLLEACNNVKVKRVFLWLAERYNYPWLSKLDLNRIDLGSGNRMLVKGGRLNTKYKISVPELS